MNELGIAADLLLAFNLGLVSQLHCAGMCGAVIGAMSFAIDPKILATRSRFAFVLSYNAGRITSYVCAGALLGALGGHGLERFPGSGGHTVLTVLAGLTLIAAGVAVLGGRGPATWLERRAMGMWMVLRRPGLRLLPIRRLTHAWLFGLLWGFLPCALVYATLVFSTTRAAPLSAAGIMLAFGLGTAPALLLAGTAGLQLRGTGALTSLRRIGGVLLVLAGLVYASLPLWTTATGHHHLH